MSKITWLMALVGPILMAADYWVHQDRILAFEAPIRRYLCQTRSRICADLKQFKAKTMADSLTLAFAIMLIAAHARISEGIYQATGQLFGAALQPLVILIVFGGFGLALIKTTSFIVEVLIPGLLGLVLLLPIFFLVKCQKGVLMGFGLLLLVVATISSYPGSS